MPTLEQIKQRSLQMPSKPKSSNSKKILKIIVGIALAWFTYTHFVPKKLVNIPEGAYAQSHFKELFDTPYKKVVWLGADCPVSKYRKNAINAMMKQTQLNRYYQHRPFLQYSLSIDGNDKIGQHGKDNADHCQDNAEHILPLMVSCLPQNPGHG